MNNLAAGTLLTALLAGCVTALAWHGTIDGQAVVGFFSALAGGGAVAGVHAAANRKGTNA